MTLYFLCLIHTQTDILKQKFVILGEFTYRSFFFFTNNTLSLCPVLHRFWCTVGVKPVNLTMTTRLQEGRTPTPTRSPQLIYRLMSCYSISLLQRKQNVYLQKCWTIPKTLFIYHFNNTTWMYNYTQSWTPSRITSAATFMHFLNHHCCVGVCVCVIMTTAQSWAPAHESHLHYQ